MNFHQPDGSQIICIGTDWLWTSVWTKNWWNLTVLPGRWEIISDEITKDGVKNTQRRWQHPTGVLAQRKTDKIREYGRKGGTMTLPGGVGMRNGKPQVCWGKYGWVIEEKTPGTNQSSDQQQRELLPWCKWSPLLDKVWSSMTIKNSYKPIAL